jgi:SAM-dependent methyltransferase
MAHSGKYSLADAFREKSPGEARALYDDWATSYERDNLSKGYRLPWMAAAVAARHLAEGTGPILDAGCGTGLVGEALSVLGYGPITGCDLSPEMMALARARDVYAALDSQDLGQPMPYPDHHFAAFTCMGCYGPGHAPPESLIELVRVTKVGGVGIFSLAEVGPSAERFAPVIRGLVEAGRWRLKARLPPFRPYVIDEPDLVTQVHVYQITG